MSAETIEWLSSNVLVGFTAKHGRAWWKAYERLPQDNHYPGPVPIEHVRERLFHWHATPMPLYLRHDPTAADGLAHAMPGFVEIPSRSAWVRSDNGHVLGIFTDGYEGHQYDEWLTQRVSLLLDGDLGIGSAGLLRGGAQGWVSVEVPDTITTPEGVSFRPNLLAVTSFDGSLATQYRRCVTNVVCDNTMRVALSERDAQTFKVRHSKNSHLKIAQARDALDLVHEVADDFQAQVRALTRTAVSEQQWKQFLDAHRPMPEEPGRARTRADKERQALIRLWTSDERVSPWRNTAYGVVQAVNTYSHHEQTVRGAARVERNRAIAVDGRVDKLDTTTLDTLRPILAA